MERTQSQDCKSLLAAYRDDCDSPLEKDVIDILIDECEDDKLDEFLALLSRIGCVSGMISKLVWHVQTHAFFDRHYDDIEQLRHEFEESVGEPLRIERDLKNTLAWFAFEETAFQIGREVLHLDI